MKAALLALPLLAACHAEFDDRPLSDASAPTDAAAPDLYRPPKCNVIFDNTNVNGVASGAVEPTFSLGSGYQLCGMWTYHWNNGVGASDVKLGLHNLTTGTTYGPYQAVGSDGQGGATNVNWDLTLNVRVPLEEGDYQVTDSDWATWSWNAPGKPGFAKVLVALVQ